MSREFEMVDEESFIWLAPDIPNPTVYAEALVMTRKAVARELLAARRTELGWKFQYDPHSNLIHEMRELGLCAPEGTTWFLSNFALVVRNRLIGLLRSGRLVFPLENEPEAAPDEVAGD